MHVPAWMLVLVRLSGIFLMAPLFGTLAVPARLKAMLALGLSFCVYPMLLGSAKAAPALEVVIDQGLSLWGLGPLLATELGIGLLLGFGATLPVAGMQIGGRVVAQQIGFGLAEVFNPSQEQGGIVSQLFYLMAILVFVLFDGHRLLLLTLVESFDRVPPGMFRFDGAVVDLIIGLLGSMLTLALKVAAPLLCLVLLQTIAIGFIARTVPQMNILSVGFAIRILLGGLVLIAVLRVDANVAAESMLSSLGTLRAFLGG